MSAASIIQDAWWALKKKRIRAGNCLSTRASSLGNPCERFLFYERTQPEKRTLHGESLQAIFDLGNHLEKYVLRELQDAGFEITESQRDWYSRELELSAHIDCRISGPGLETHTIEAKGLNPFTAESIKTLDDIRNNRSSWVRKYYTQAQAYCYLGEIPAIFAMLNKSSGEIRLIDCPYDADFIKEHVVAKAARIRDAVKSGVAPARIDDSQECQRCAFAHVCMPDITFGEAPEVLDDPELEAALARRAELKEAADRFAEVDLEIKEKLKNRPRVLIGDWVVTGKSVSRKGYTVEPSSYWQSTIRALGDR